MRPLFSDARSTGWLSLQSLECNKGHSMVAGLASAWATAHFTSKASFLVGFLSVGSLGNATSSGCGKLLSLRHPLETSAGEGRRLGDRSQEVTSSPLCRTLKGASWPPPTPREQNVDGRYQRHLKAQGHRPQPSISF